MTSMPPPRTAHPYYMYDAIQAQPAALRTVLAANRSTLESAAARLRTMEHVVVCGIGTSWHAALVGELALARGLGHRVRALHAFELASYWPPPPARTGVVAISHSGSTRFTGPALARAAGSGGAAITITGTDAPRAAETDFALTTVPRETSTAHTVSYTTALALLVALAAAAGGDATLMDDGERIADGVAAMLAPGGESERWSPLAARFADRRRFWFVGGGPNAATAYEAALKMSETNHATATGIECEQFLHGAWAAMTRDDLLVLIVPPGPSRARCLDAARIARALGTAVMAIAPRGDRELAAVATETIPLPDVDEFLSPIVAIVPLQLLAYHLAVARGVNPDIMRAAEPSYARARELVTL